MESLILKKKKHQIEITVFLKAVALFGHGVYFLSCCSARAIYKPPVEFKAWYLKEFIW